MLAARKVPGLALWLTWTDTVFFEAMSKIYPAGKTQQIANLQDYLAKTRCDWFIDNHQASLLSFVGEINEGTRVYSAELARATSGGFSDSVQREAVSTLLNRVNSGVNDSDRQPPSVRARLNTRILFDGRPKNIDDFILHMLTEADFIATCNDRDTSAEGKRAAAKAAAAGSGKVQQQRGGPGGAPTTKFVCNGCGGPGHKYRDCPLSAHTDFNGGKGPWATSDSGKRLAASGQSSIPTDKSPKKKWEGKRGAVMDNYCSKAVGDWTRLNFLQSWEKYKDNDTVELACKGASAEPL
ncbi:hypothetical protein B484DRAFT_472975, partial [Ochromonadaceae sp. CCMP2298]